MHLHAAITYLNKYFFASTQHIDDYRQINKRNYSNCLLTNDCCFLYVVVAAAADYSCLLEDEVVDKNYQLADNDLWTLSAYCYYWDMQVREVMVAYDGAYQDELAMAAEEQFPMGLLDMVPDNSLTHNCTDDDGHYYLKAVTLWTHHNHYSTPTHRET